MDDSFALVMHIATRSHTSRCLLRRQIALGLAHHFKPDSHSWLSIGLASTAERNSPDQKLPHSCTAEKRRIKVDVEMGKVSKLTRCL